MLAEYCNDLDAEANYNCWQDYDTQKGYNYKMDITLDAFKERPVRSRFQAVIIRKNDNAVIGTISMSPENALPDLAKEIIFMSKAYDFLKECGSFFVLSINGEYPAGRPFGAVMEVGEDLFLSTNDMNQAHKQMRANEHIQIVAKKPTSREWIRITGIATECDDKKLKQRMLEECPILQQRFGAVGMEHFIMFKVKVEDVEIK